MRISPGRRRKKLYISANLRHFLGVMTAQRGGSRRPMRKNVHRSGIWRAKMRKSSSVRPIACVAGVLGNRCRHVSRLSPDSPRGMRTSCCCPRRDAAGGCRRGSPKGTPQPITLASTKEEGFRCASTPPEKRRAPKTGPFVYFGCFCALQQRCPQLVAGEGGEVSRSDVENGLGARLAFL